MHSFRSVPLLRPLPPSTHLETKRASRTTPVLSHHLFEPQVWTRKRIRQRTRRRSRPSALRRAGYDCDLRAGRSGWKERRSRSNRGWFDLSTRRAFRFLSLLTLLSQNHSRPFYSKRRVFRSTSPWMKTTRILRIGCVTIVKWLLISFSHLYRLPQFPLFFASCYVLLDSVRLSTLAHLSPSRPLSLSYNLNATTVLPERRQREKRERSSDVLVYENVEKEESKSRR